VISFSPRGYHQIQQGRLLEGLVFFGAGFRCRKHRAREAGRPEGKRPEAFSSPGKAGPTGIGGALGKRRQIKDGQRKKERKKERMEKGHTKDTNQMNCGIRWKGCYLI
jgi:hypothetical protein